MADELGSLRIILNSTNLQKDNPRLYQFLNNLLNGTIKVEDTVAVVSGSIPAAGFVTSTIGGSPDTISMFTAIRNIENVTLAGISNALDLLP